MPVELKITRKAYVLLVVNEAKYYIDNKQTLLNIQR